jgi:hypothetical protein
MLRVGELAWRLGPVRTGAKFDSLVDDYTRPSLVAVEDEAVDANFFISLFNEPLSISLPVRIKELTATQIFSIRSGKEDTVAKAERNQQSPSFPCLIEFELAAPPEG